MSVRTKRIVKCSSRLSNYFQTWNRLSLLRIHLLIKTSLHDTYAPLTLQMWQSYGFIACETLTEPHGCHDWEHHTAQYNVLLEAAQAANVGLRRLKEAVVQRRSVDSISHALDATNLSNFVGHLTLHMPSKTFSEITILRETLSPTWPQSSARPTIFRTLICVSAAIALFPTFNWSSY